MLFRPLLIALVLTLVAARTGYAAEPEFPFDHVLNMDVPLMKPSKRKPSLTVAANGTATIDLWCNSLQGRVEVSGEAITITPGDMPEAPPAMISYGQCTPERMQADETLRQLLAQVSSWRLQGGVVVLSGPETLRFFPSTN